MLLLQQACHCHDPAAVFAVMTCGLETHEARTSAYSESLNPFHSHSEHSPAMTLSCLVPAHELSCSVVRPLFF
jgi:hypothetical protein